LEPRCPSPLSRIEVDGPSVQASIPELIRNMVQGEYKPAGHTLSQSDDNTERLLQRAKLVAERSRILIDETQELMEKTRDILGRPTLPLTRRNKILMGGRRR
jgi:hypothetical protein